MRTCKNTIRGGNDFLTAQNGWNGNGTRKMVKIQTRWDIMGCKYPERFRDPGCAGCKWTKTEEK